MACEELIDKVHQNAPESLIGIMVFGPDFEPGVNATKVLHDFSTDTNALKDSLRQIDGAETVGTPLCDVMRRIVGESPCSA